ncbi:MAG: beta-galactosidase trimerization domain-containing protein [Bryobacterales bacterium]|nr:beta-galactosidase trimerization domain-containing protein [Bryobacterales bacterium]
MLGHDLEPNRIYKEASRVGAEWKALGPRLVNFTRKNDVAILYSVDSHHGIEAMPFDDKTNYLTVLHQMHRALFNLNVGTDFVFPETEDLSRYKVILVPPLYVASDTLLQRLSDFVRNGGHLVMSFKSGFTDENDTVRHTRMPGPLREAAGFSYQEFSTIKGRVPFKRNSYATNPQANAASVWAEMLIPEGAKTLVSYDHPFFGQYPAITRNAFGKGTLTYEGTVLSDELQRSLLAEELALHGSARSREAACRREGEARNRELRQTDALLPELFSRSPDGDLRLRRRQGVDRKQDRSCKRGDAHRPLGFGNR